MDSPHLDIMILLGRRYHGLVVGALKFRSSMKCVSNKVVFTSHGIQIGSGEKDCNFEVLPMLMIPQFSVV
jgi:hypothetical protein